MSYSEWLAEQEGFWVSLKKDVEDEEEVEEDSVEICSLRYIFVTLLSMLLFFY